MAKTQSQTKIEEKTMSLNPPTQESTKSNIIIVQTHCNNTKAQKMMIGQPTKFISHLIKTINQIQHGKKASFLLVLFLL
jgi:hypothetical protein